MSDAEADAEADANSTLEEKDESDNDKNNRINIVMGSSYVGTIDTEGLFKNWTRYDDGGQNVYESYKFLKY